MPISQFLTYVPAQGFRLKIVEIILMMPFLVLLYDTSRTCKRARACSDPVLTCPSFVRMLMQDSSTVQWYSMQGDCEDWCGISIVLQMIFAALIYTVTTSLGLLVRVRNWHTAICELPVC